MAQTQTVTNTGIAEWVTLMCDTTPSATALYKIVALDMATPCTAAVASTFADPADSAVHHTTSGLAIVAIDTVAQATKSGGTAGDSVDFDHVFTATAAKNVAGIHVCNTAGNKTYIECCFNAVLAMESSDTLTIDGQVTANQT